MINVSERINVLMKNKGWSPYELSMQTGISINAVYDWFKIGSTPSMQNIIKICEAMGITLEQFFCGGNYEYTEEENKILIDWCELSDLEKNAIKSLMETFKILKNK